MNDERPVWQPIETAPKDVTEVLAWYPPNHGELGFHEIIIVPISQNRRDLALPGGVWPTHWMPLPEPPEGA